jgi:hypothetical protein
MNLPLYNFFIISLGLLRHFDIHWRWHCDFVLKVWIFCVYLRMKWWSAGVVRIMGLHFTNFGEGHGGVA